MSEHYRKEYSSGEINIITPYLKQIDQAAHAGVFGQGLMEIYKTTHKLNLQEIEKLLRQEGCRTFLIGLQIAGKEVAIQYDVKLSGTDRIFPYWLWIEVNWEQAALNKLREEGISAQQNFERLADTGLLVLKPGNPLSRSLKANLN